MVTVELDHVTKAFGKTIAVNDVSFTVKQGELFFLLGPSGCGKTTALRLMAGFYKPDKGKIVLGEVHDENAYAMEGVAGHAGLFTTANDLAKFSCILLGQGVFRGKRVLSSQVVELMTRCHNFELGGCYGLGWMTNRNGDAGDLFSEIAYGHTGFTGTSIWIDPEREISTILLTNAIHPSREHKSLASVRACFNNAVVASIGEY
ncbi:MAG: serine hydrolase [Thermoproteota archaeon]